VKADLLLRGGAVHPLGRFGARAVTHLAVAGQRVLAAGGRELDGLRGPGTRVVDLEGRAVLPGFDPGSYLDQVARYRATEINLVPTMLGMLVTSGAAERADLSTLRAAVYGASPMPRPLVEQVLELWGPRLVQYYGQTEAPLCISVLDRHDHLDRELLGSCGSPAVDAEVAVTAAQHGSGILVISDENAGPELAPVLCAAHAEAWWLL